MRVAAWMLVAASLLLGGCPKERPGGEGKPTTVIGSWQVWPGCTMSNGMRVETRVRGTGTRKLVKTTELAELIKRHQLMDIPGVQGYSVGLCCYKDPREALCLMFVLDAGAQLRRFVASVDAMLADEDLGIELSVIRDSGAPLPTAPNF